MPTPSHFHRRQGRARSAYWALMAGSTLLMVACATQTPPPVALMAVSTAAVADAASAGGVEHAPEQMRLAREKLEKARVAMKDEDNERARKLASEAQVDAQLAQAKSHAARAVTAALAVKEDGRVLREEMQRKAR